MGVMVVNAFREGLVERSGRSRDWSPVSIKIIGFSQTHFSCYHALLLLWL